MKDYFLRNIILYTVLKVTKKVRPEKTFYTQVYI